MKVSKILAFSAAILLTGCLNIEEDPILVINPTAQVSAHIKDRKIYSTVLVSANPQVLVAGNIPARYEFTGELAIYNTRNGAVLDVTAFSGGGISQVYTVSADTVTHDRFVVIASGRIQAYGDVGNDGNEGNDKEITSGDFHTEVQYIVSDLVNPLQP